MLSPVPRAVLQRTPDVLLDTMTEVMHLDIKKKRRWEIAYIESEVGIHDAEARAGKESVVSSHIAGHVHHMTACAQGIRYLEL